MKKQHAPTVAQTLFKDHQILQARPEEMTFDEYRYLRYTQDLVLRKMFKRCPERRLINIIPGPVIYRTKRHRINSVTE